MTIKKAIGYTLAALFVAGTVYIYTLMPWYMILICIGVGLAITAFHMIIMWLLKEDLLEDDDLEDRNP